MPPLPVAALASMVGVVDGAEEEVEDNAPPFWAELPAMVEELITQMAEASL